MVNEGPHDRAIPEPAGADVNGRMGKVCSNGDSRNNRSEPFEQGQIPAPDNEHSGALPLTIAVTGHRDILKSEASEIGARVRDLFADLIQRYPERRIVVLSPLAEGADQLVAKEALALGLGIVVPLPMPLELYLTDFETDEARSRFRALYDQADTAFDLPLAKNNSIEDIVEHGPARDLQYAQLGIFLCAHCHLLLALWDGKEGGDLGGTAQVVQFHHDDIMPGFTEAGVGSHHALIDDESDLVYHIVCSRDRPNGAPHAEFSPLECWWYTKDQKSPRSLDLPDQHKLIFDRSAEFSREALKFADRIDAEKYPLLGDGDEEKYSPGLGTINRLFCVADWLAIYYQKRVLFSLRATHIFAFLMGFMFILYSDLETSQYFMIAFLAFFALAASVQYMTTRGGWHRRYLDYRALAEGLRVQFYWAAAGVGNESDSKFAHDNFLQSQDAELGWIRNVMRVAGTRCDASRNHDSAGLEFVMREWVGDHNSGQLGYYRKKTLEKIKHTKLTERLALLSLITGVGGIAAILFYGAQMPEDYLNPLMVAMGGMLLLVGVRHGYAFSIAERELIKQYEFMLRIYHNSHRRMEDSTSDAVKRQILRAVGTAALNEQAQWILMHRDRSMDQSDLWLMSG